MLDPRLLERSDIGRKVVFVDHPDQRTVGVLQGFTKKLLFVKFPDSLLAEACKPRQVRWANDKR